MTLRRGMGLLAAAVLSVAAAPAAAQASSFGFGSPVLVDRTLAGGEPSTAYAVKSGLLIYTAHEGTTHVYSSATLTAPAESGGWVGNYRNQVNIWWSANNGRSWQRVNFGGGFFTNPLINTGFSDPDLTQDESHNIYNTGIDLANDALFSSQDGGKTWPTGTPQCHEGDRPWLAGGEAKEVFLSTDSDQGGHQFFHSTDAGATCSANGIPDFGNTKDGGTFNGQGKPIYDDHLDNLVEPIWYYDKNNVIDGVGVGILNRPNHAFKTGKGKFKQVRVARTTGYSHWPSLARDAKNNYYLVWDTDARNKKTTNGCPSYYTGSETFGGSSPANTPLANRVMMSVSTDGGLKWSKPVTVGYAPGHRLLWPWVAAGRAGNAGVVWYQYDRVTDPDCGSGKVYVMAARVTHATSAHPTITVVNASHKPIHDGAICAGGTTCVVTAGVIGEDRRLGDYFTNNVDARGCLIIATGYTGLTDAVSGQKSPISHPWFLHQNSGTGLFGKPCS